jgi:N-acetylglucosaminyldiphosphoundecaprenol N-acetyl-beta-D-mannosaminyltransferase
VTALQDAITDANAYNAVGSFVACGVRIDVAGFDGSVEEILRSAAAAGRAVHLCNTYTLSLARRDPGYARLLNRGDLNLPDGRPVAMLAKRLGLTDTVERVGGPDLMAAVFDRGRGVGLRHYLYGATQETVDRLQARLAERYPGVQIAGAEAPPFRPLTADERQAMIGRVRTAKPHVIWIGLGTPKQDEFVDAFRDELGATLVAVGAAFEFLAGVKPRAPYVLQQLGMEWAFRLVSEPRRLWRRYLFGGATFLAGIVSDWRTADGFQVTRPKGTRPQP